MFESGLPITMMGLDVTHQAVFLTQAADRLRALGTKSGAVAAELTDYALQREGQWYGTPRMSVHDAVAIAHLAVADLVSVAEYDVQVDTGSGPARGRTVFRGEGVAKRDLSEAEVRTLQDLAARPPAGSRTRTAHPPRSRRAAGSPRRGSAR